MHIFPIWATFRCGLITICTEALAFFTAAMCLLLCSTGEPGSALVLSAAVMGRLCLDVCFTTVYVGLGAIFSGSGAKTALMICEATARLGGIIAPLSGTWPTSVSWLKDVKKAVTISMICGDFWKQVLPCDLFLEMTVIVFCPLAKLSCKVSCPVFASACLAAAYCSMTLPQSRKSLDASTDTKQVDFSGSEPILKLVKT